MTTAETRKDDGYHEILNELAKLNNSERRAPPISLIDPTANVLSLVAAETKRQDDLREAEKERLDIIQKLEVKRIDDLRTEGVKYQDNMRQSDSRRLQELHNAEQLRRDNLLNVEIQHRRELANVETDRVNAILAANAATLSANNNAAEQRAATLAERVDTTAKAQQVTLETTAKNIAESNAATVKALTDRIESNYNATTERFKPLEESRFQQQGQIAQTDKGSAGDRALLATGLSILSIIFAAALAIHAFTTTPTPVTAPPPVINVYVPGATPVPK